MDMESKQGEETKLCGVDTTNTSGWGHVHPRGLAVWWSILPTRPRILIV